MLPLGLYLSNHTELKPRRSWGSYMSPSLWAVVKILVPFLDSYYTTEPKYFKGTPRGDHNFDSHPHGPLNDDAYVPLRPSLGEGTKGETLRRDPWG